VKTHKDLEIYQLALKLVRNIYHTTKSFPDPEKYGLTSQIRKAAISVPSNISEGAARSSTKEFINFLYYSLGSLAEMETQLIIAADLGYLSEPSDILETVEKLRRKFLNFIKYQKSKLKT